MFSTGFGSAMQNTQCLVDDDAMDVELLSDSGRQLIGWNFLTL